MASMARVNKPSKSMSYEELKSNLLQRFQNQGILSQMKAEMRSKLVQELFQTVSFSNEQFSGGEERDMLQEQVSNWLVCDHLQRQKYEFTLSTFLQESGMVKSPKTILSTQDILFLLGISENLPLSRELNATNRGSGNSFLFTIVKNAIEMHVRSKKNNVSTETWREQLRLIDETFEKKKGTQTEEENVYQRVMKEVEELRSRIDRELEKKTKILEQGMLNGKKYSSTEAVPVQGQKNVNEMSIGDNKSKLNKNNTSMLEAKEEQLRNWEDRLTLMAKSLEKQKFQENVETQHSEDINENLQEMKLKMDMLVSQLNFLEKENGVMRKNLEDMADYSTIKMELDITKHEAKACMERLENSRREWQATKDKLEQTIAELTLKLSNPCSELLKAHQEVQRIQDSYKLDHAVWHRQRNSLENHLEEIKQLYQRTLLRNENQRSQLEAQEQMINVLRQQLFEKDNVPLISDAGQFNRSTEPNNYFAHHFESPSLYGVVNAETLPPPFHPPHFLMETKQRIEQMQAESEQLEKRYRQFVETEFLSLNMQPFGRTPFGSMPNLVNSHMERTHCASFNKASFCASDLGPAYDSGSQPFAYSFRGSYPYRFSSEDVSRLNHHRDISDRQHIHSENRNRGALGDPRLRASMPVLSEHIPAQDSVDHGRALYKRFSLSTPSDENKYQSQLPDWTLDSVEGKEFEKKHDGEPEVDHKEDSYLIVDLKLAENELRNEYDKTSPPHLNSSVDKDSKHHRHENGRENEYGSTSSEIPEERLSATKLQNSEIFDTINISEQSPVVPIESMYFRNDLGDSALSTNVTAVSHHENSAMQHTSLVQNASNQSQPNLHETDRLGALETESPNRPLELELTNADLRGKDIASDCPPKKPLEIVPHMQNEAPVSEELRAHAETAQINNAPDKLGVPVVFRPSNHSTPVRDKVPPEPTNDRKVQEEVDQSDGELEISIGEQKSSSNDSFW